MNFKDAYKSYNDEIKGNPEILDAILNKEQKKKPVFFLRPSFACAVAAVFAVAVSVVGFNKFGNISQEQAEPTKTYIAAKDISYNNEAEKKQEQVQKNDDKKQSDKLIVAQNTSEPDNKNIQSPSKNTTSGKAGRRSYIPQVKESNTPQNTIPDKSDEPVIEDTTTGENTNTGAPLEASIPPQDETDENFRDPGMPMAIRTIPEEAAYSPDEVSYEECTNYLGVDVIKKTELPDDMDFNPECIVNAQKNEETGEIVSGGVTASAVSGVDSERTLSLSVSKNESEPLQKEYFYNETSGEVVGARSVSETVEIVLDSQKVTKTEIDTIMDSLQTN